MLFFHVFKIPALFHNRKHAERKSMIFLLKQEFSPF